MGDTFFFDIPVYRLARDRYYQEREGYIDGVLFPKSSPESEELRARDRADPGRNAYMRGYLESKYGGCWEFNEIIGYIRLHFLGSQIRGEYYGVSSKRIVRTRTKTLEFKTWKLASEVELPDSPSQAGILETIHKYLDDCKKELPGRYLDTSIFEAIARHVDWRSLFQSRF